MDNTSLKAKPPLGGYRKTFGDTTLQEMTGLAIIAIATSNGGAVKVPGRDHNQLAVSANDPLDAPAPGTSNVIHQDQIAIRLLSLRQDLILAVFTAQNNRNAIEALRNKFGRTIPITDQSDAWVVLGLSGPLSESALERICSIDLHQDVFANGDLAQTRMEHISTILFRSGDEAFQIFAPRSYARSFLHAVETSIHNVR